MPPRNRAREAQRAAAAALPPVWEITDRPSAEALAEEIFRTDRATPLLVISSASDTGQPRVSVDDVRAAVGESVHLAVLTSPRAAAFLSDNLPEGIQVFGGAVRLYGPYATRGDDPATHPIFTTFPDDIPAITLRKIEERLRRLGYLEAPIAPTTEPRAPWADEEAAPPADSRETALAAALEASKAEAVELRRQVRSLSDQVAELERRLQGRDVYADPERQLRHEIETDWLLGESEAERARYPLAEFVVGGAFLSSLDSLEGVSREKVVGCLVEVLTGRVFALAGRQAHQMRTSEAGGAPYRVRDDGAALWRASLQVNTPGARRLHWWALPDGRIELHSVGHHDDAV